MSQSMGALWDNGLMGDGRGMDDLPEDEMGPKMLALRSPQQRRFAWLVANGVTNGAEAARQAGYSDHLEAAKVRSCRMMHNPMVLAAIEEAGRKAFRGLAPVAIGAARAILEQPKHPAHARMIEVVLDRTGYGARSEHKVVVEHTADVRQLEDLARRLAEANGIAPERFIGVNGGPVIDLPVKEIEGEVSRETNESASD